MYFAEALIQNYNEQPAKQWVSIFSCIIFKNRKNFGSILTLILAKPTYVVVLYSYMCVYINLSKHKNVLLI